MKVCNTCNLEKPNKSYGINNSFADNLQRICRVCYAAQRELRYDPNKAKIAWSKNKYSSSELAEDRRLRAAYGISKEFRDYMSARANGSCEICGEECALVVDHDHTTGVTRGMLCSKCNRGLGHFGDKQLLLSKALEYLQIKDEQNTTEFAG